MKLLKQIDHGKVMREYRFKHGLSQSDMAQKMNMTQQLYSNVETGRTRLSVEFASLFKAVTGVNLILPLTSPPQEVERHEPQYQDEDCQVLRERVNMKDEVIAALKSQIALLERVMAK